MSPEVIASFVAALGAAGLFAASWAVYQLRRERRALAYGRAALRDLSVPSDTSFDYRDWLAGQGLRVNDSHFAEHLLAAADSSRSGRALSLRELHEVSARREGRRPAARFAEGVIALLLVVGIAGTLLAIKPLLGNFSLVVTGAGLTEVSDNLVRATRLIRSLSDAFVPSLVALGATVLVAVMRGVYVYRRWHLAGELDRFDLEDLLQRFPPPSVTREMNEIRAQLAELVARMLSSQQKVTQFVTGLSQSAARFHGDVPDLVAASLRADKAVNGMAGGLADLALRLDTHFGPGSPLLARLDQVGTCAADMQAAAAQVRSNGDLLAQALRDSHHLLKVTADNLPEQLRAAGQDAGAAIGTATASAVTAACRTTVQELQSAAQPVRDAAAAVATADQALRSDLTTIADGIRHDLQHATARLQEELEQGLASAVDRVLGIHQAAQEAIARGEVSVSQMRELQDRIEHTLREAGRGAAELLRVDEDLQGATGRLTESGRRLEESTARLAQVQQAGAALAERLAGVGREVHDDIGVSREVRAGLLDIAAIQETTVRQLGETVGESRRVAAVWEEMEARLDGRGESLGRLLREGRELGVAVRTAGEQLAERQARLDAAVAALVQALERRRALRSRGLLDGIFGRRP